jgi:Beta-propeller repeat/Protein of unknown function (DUF1573)
MWTRLRVASVTVVGALAIGSGLGLSADKHQGAEGKAPTRLVAMPPAQARVSSSSKSTAYVSAAYGKLPLAFEPNVGQAKGDAKFLAHGDGYALLLNADSAVLALRGLADKKLAANEHPNVLRMKLVGAKADARLAAVDELPGKSNYLIGKTPADWHTNVPTYRKVAEQGIYPGIDLVYYGAQNELEYDFVVAPGARPTAIRLAIQGATSLRVDQRGELVIALPSGDVRMRKPVVYQQAGAEKQIVAANYALDGERGVRFAVGAYDHTRPLIIDPILAYSTSLGGSNIDGANAIAVAPDNTAFIAGGTFSTNFPTAHPLQPDAGGPNDFSQDGFVAKISADGSTLLYSTYLGGSEQDVANGIAVDPFGDAYVTGTTLSSNFPVTPGSLNTECGGDGKCGASYNPSGLIVSNAFVAKLNPEGSALIYSTYLGEYENVRGQAIAVDANQNAYVTGQTEANGVPTVPITPPAVGPPNFPITASAFQGAFGGGSTDCFITKITATGTSALYSSYLGGSDEDTCYGVAVDSNQNAYVAGLTYSINLPLVAATQGAYGGAGDGFISKINTNGTGAGSLVFSTYLGGSGLDEANGVAADNSGHVYVAGLTNSASLPQGTGSGIYAGQGDAFAAEYATPPSLGAALMYFTYVGGSLADSANGIAIDSLGDAYIAGSTVSTNFPSTGAPFQPAFNGGNADAFVTELNPTGSMFVYSSYLGGTNTDIAYGIAVDSAGAAYVAGQTCSPDFPQSNPLPIAAGGNCDAFISKVSILQGIAVNPSGLNFPTQSLNTTSQPLTATITNGQNALNITGITVTGQNAADFVASQNCVGAMAAGAQCAISVTFTPTAAGIRKASLNITNSGIANPTVVVALTGSTSSITLSTSTLSFGTPENPQPVGVTSAAQSIKVTNSGASPITISSITASGDFAETDNCTAAALQPTTNCVINVTYKPSGSGSSIGAVTITDNAAGSPQVVLLNGNAVVEQFAISALAVNPTVPAGQAAGYTLSITPYGGFSQPVALSCSGLPFGATCSASQNPVTLTGSGSTQVTLNINTEARTALPATPRTKLGPPPSLLGLVALSLSAALLTLVLLTTFGTIKDRRILATMAFAAGLMALTAGCNGGSTAGAPSGTPAGTYQVTITATSANATTQSTVVTLQVK